MAIYGGGKAKIGHHIYDVINKELESLVDKGYKEYRIYIEPFCGMLGIAHHFIKNEKFNKYILSDKNNNIILMWNKLKKGNWILPAPCNKEEYKILKNSKKETALKGYYGVSCAYYGIFQAGYKVNIRSRDKTQKLGELLNKYNSTNEGSPFKVKIVCKSYDSYNPKGMVIYCDPPYKNTGIGNLYFKDFDTDKFWNIMRQWSDDNLVFISEYEAPDDFECIWEKNINSIFNGNMKTKTEKLFRYKK